MSQSTRSPQSRKAVALPEKPYPEFPLTPHAGGKWQKKICGKIHYFGRWYTREKGKVVRTTGDGWKEALELYKAQADDLHAGRTPSATIGGLTLIELCNKFLQSKEHKLNSGELGSRIFLEYKEVKNIMVSLFGQTRPVENLQPGDFESLRAKMAKRWGPTRLGNAITRVKSFFKYGIESGLIEKAIRFGPEFKKPSKAVLRRHRATKPKKMIEPGELHKLISAADPTMRAMIYLGLNAAMGNHDCATLPQSALDLKTAWIDFPRPKTGIDRRCPLWPETIQAIREALEVRPEPARVEDSELLFISSRKTAFVRTTEASHTDLITVQFQAMLKKLGLHREGLGFYTLRHIFRTIADAARDPVVTDIIMGHTDESMGAHYREQIDDSRFQAVVDHVHGWLFGKAESREGGKA
jgi:integrase